MRSVRLLRILVRRPCSDILIRDRWRDPRLSVIIATLIRGYRSGLSVVLWFLVVARVVRLVIPELVPAYVSTRSWATAIDKTTHS